jgi:glycosyltransferase involved in cell wall biosynthesis
MSDSIQSSVRETIEIDFVVRSDSLAKGGGDSAQVAQYESYLRNQSLDVRVLPFHPSMTFRVGAIVHIINVDRPYDFLRTCKLAKGHRVFVSPIHHNLVNVRQMRLDESGYGLRSILGRVLPESCREWLAFGARSMISSITPAKRVGALMAFVKAGALVPTVWQRVGRELDNVSKVLLLASGEGTALRADTGWRGENAALVPNGFPKFDPDSGSPRVFPWTMRDISILSVGRIEPRKRQLEMAKLASEHKVPITLAGPLLQPRGDFGKDFLETVQESEYVTWVGEVPHEEVLNLMGRSKVLLNASWVEVQSLVDLEAAFLGCFIVANDGGNSHEWLAGQVLEVIGSDLAEMLHESEKLAARLSGPNAPEYEWSWESVGRKVHELYVSSGRLGVS